MSNRYVNPRPKYTLPDGSPIVDGYLDIYETGTTQRKDTFKDANQTIANPNPLPLLADGSVPNCFYSGTARIVLFSASEGQQFDVDGAGQFGDGSAFDVWNSVIEYQENALVEASNGQLYRSLQNNNIGNDPSTSPQFWEQVEFTRTWNPNVTYNIDDIVKASDGLIYSSNTTGNINNDPTGGADPTNWGSPVFGGSDQNLSTTDDVTFNSVTAPSIITDTISPVASGTVAIDINATRTLVNNRLDAANVAITGGDITGITDLAIADGGTGASTASAARNNLGLGTIATQDADSVDINGGAVDGVAVGATTPSTGAFTTITTTGTADFSGTVSADTLQSLTGSTVTIGDDLDVNGNVTAVDGTYRSTRNITALFNQSTAVTRFVDLDFLSDNGGTCNFRIGRGTNNAGDVVFQVFRGDGSSSLTFQVDRDGALIRGNLNFPDLPTSSSGLSSGDVWRDPAAGNVLKQVP